MSYNGWILLGPRTQRYYYVYQLESIVSLREPYHRRDYSRSFDVLDVVKNVGRPDLYGFVHFYPPWNLSDHTLLGLFGIIICCPSFANHSESILQGSPFEGEELHCGYEPSLGKLCLITCYAPL